MGDRRTAINRSTGPYSQVRHSRAAYMAWWRFKAGSHEMPRCFSCGSVFLFADHGCAMEGR